MDGSVNQGNITYFMMQQLGEKLAESFNLSSGAVHTWGTVFARYVGLSMFLSLTGALFTLIYSPLKQLMEGTPEKVWPGKLGKIENGVPKNAMKAQFIIVTLMILLNMGISLINKGAADKFFLVITNMSNIASSLPYVFIVFAYIKFKKNTFYDYEKSSFCYWNFLGCSLDDYFGGLFYNYRTRHKLSPSARGNSFGKCLFRYYLNDRRTSCLQYIRLVVDPKL